MANNLGRNIAAGEVVIVCEGAEVGLGNEFVCAGQGFGSMSFTSGYAVIGHWKNDPAKNPTRIEGYDIDREATNALAAQNAPAAEGESGT